MVNWVKLSIRNEDLITSKTFGKTWQVERSATSLQKPVRFSFGFYWILIPYGVFEPIGRAIENLRWQSDYWLWNDGEGSHANFFVSPLDHFWHFQEYLDANHDQLTPEECDGEKAVCLSSSNTFAEELAQADHFEVERDILLTQLIGLSEPFMEEMEEAA